MKDKTLLILAAGLGSRFGGSKQTEPIGPNGEFIIDYSVYDAVENGFNKIVFIIKEENYDAFKNSIGKRIENKLNTKNIKVEYVFQNLNNLPEGYTIPAERVKPLGTAHAILCAKNVINEPFLIINADDFYGKEAYKDATEYIDANPNTIGIISYKVKNTITENGAVKRGICTIEDGRLISLVESSIVNENGTLKATPLEGGEEKVISEDTSVSMNMISFPPMFFNYIEDKFTEFLDSANLLKDEYLIPTVIAESMKEEKYNVNVTTTNAKWSGITYKEDKEQLVEHINRLIENNEYPNNLWD